MIMNSVEKILIENIDDPNALFVFPTDIAVSGWADRLLRLRGNTIAMNRFIAWDKFKQKSIKSKVKDKKSIPSALRKIFTSRLIIENSEAVKNGNTPVFSSLITVKWAEHSQQFSPWLTGLLPQLGVWFSRTTGLSIDSILSEDAKKAGAKFEDDDKDTFTLAVRYALFLEKYSFFEPAWETPPFNNDGKNCFIFFPEALSDFCEYRELLSGYVNLISASPQGEFSRSSSGRDDDEIAASHTFFYTNARREITEASLYIRALHEKNNIPWDSIVVSVPDSENYEPYVLREFSNRNIPYAKRTSKPLTDFTAGQFFRSVIDCVSQDFAFSPFIGLVLNKNLKWKDEEKISNLVDFGIKNNCVCSWSELPSNFHAEEEDEENEKNDGSRQTTVLKERHINVWEDAFYSPVSFLDKESRDFFYDLKKHTCALRQADSFLELRRQYFIFRERFLDMDNCSEETDQVFSRCIAELMELTVLEKNYPDVPAPDPFLFFTEYLSEVNYLAQAKTTGVAILPYKTAASAPFDCHIILGAVQNNISVVYSRLNFLPKKKREEIGIIDEDASLAFINLHKYNSRKISAFFCSELTFSGFEIAHSKIGSPLKPKENYTNDPKYCEFFSGDYYLFENDFSASEGFFLHENQKNGFFEWKNRRFSKNYESSKPLSDVTLKYIKDKLSYHNAHDGTGDNKISVSASSLKIYCQCFLKWLLNRIGLENTEVEASLMSQHIYGNVYHAALDLFFTNLKNNEETLLKPVISANTASLPDKYKKLLLRCINIINVSPSPRINDEKNETIKTSALTTRFLQAAQDQFVFNLENCLVNFLSFFSGCSVIGCEKWYQTQKETYFLNGKSDCILRDENGKYIIIDFKLANLPKRKDCTGEGDKGLCDLQLPMYITLAENNENIIIETALFFSIIKQIPEVIIGNVYDEINNINYPKRAQDRVERHDETYKQLIEIFDNKVKQFADEIITGNFSIFETNYNECYNCEYSRICRKVYTIKNEKNITLGKRE